MNEGKAIYTILTEDAGVSAVVGNKVYPQIAAQGAALTELWTASLHTPPL